MKVYLLIAPIYCWDDGTYTVGVYKSMKGAKNAAKDHTELCGEYKIIAMELLQ